MAYACLLYTSVQQRRDAVEKDTREERCAQHHYADEDRALAVSYTHLDVYKRQVVCGANDGTAGQRVYAGRFRRAGRRNGGYRTAGAAVPGGRHGGYPYKGTKRKSSSFTFT